MKKILTFLFIPLLFACSGEEDISNRAFLLSGESSKSWQLVSISEGDKTGIPLNCVSDDLEVFFNDQSYNYQHGDKSCPNEYNLNGNWLLSDDFKTITINYTDDSLIPMIYKIVSLSNDKMVLEVNSFSTQHYEYELVQ